MTAFYHNNYVSFSECECKFLTVTFAITCGREQLHCYVWFFSPNVSRLAGPCFLSAPGVGAIVIFGQKMFPRFPGLSTIFDATSGQFPGVHRLWTGVRPSGKPLIGALNVQAKIITLTITYGRKGVILDPVPRFSTLFVPSNWNLAQITLII